MTIPTIEEFCELHLGLTLYPAQRVILKSACGVPLTHEEADLFRLISGRDDPAHAFRVVTVAGGARGGKTGFIIAPLVLWHARYGDNLPAKGEVVRIGLVAQDLSA